MPNRFKADIAAIMAGLPIADERPPSLVELVTRRHRPDDGRAFIEIGEAMGRLRNATMGSLEAQASKEERSG